jgi:hypothetical protein
MYWLAVARAGEAIDMLFSGQARTMGWSKFFTAYPVTMHPDFPAAVEAGAEITRQPGQAADAQWCALAQWLRQAQNTSRQNAPQGYVVALFNLGIDLKSERGGERRANLQEAVNSFQRAADMYTLLNDVVMLQRARTEIAEVSSMLANL